MPINLIALNGKSRLIDYEDLEKSLKAFLGLRCSEATMYVFNNFPAVVSSECKIDILILISLHDIQGNYTRYLSEKDSYEYFRNLILPITINTSFENRTIQIVENFLEIDGYEYSNIDELNSLKFGLLNFLENNCNMEKGKLFIRPVELIINSHVNKIFESSLIGNRFSGDQLFMMLQQYPKLYFQSYQPWKGAANYQMFKDNAALINDAAGKFTTYGYLTQKKIERIAGQLARDSAMFESIGKQTTLISGKAGTGKTTHLYHLFIRLLINNRNVTFLTYNHLLTKEIACHIKVTQDGLFKRWESEGKDPSTFACATVQTLMGFMFRLTRNLMVLHLMTEERINELKAVLQDSLSTLEAQLPALLQQNASQIFGVALNWNAVIEVIQNSHLNVSEKQYGILLIKYLRKHHKSITVGLRESISEFQSYKLSQLEEMTQKEVFLADYLGCLRNAIEFIRNPEKIYAQYDVRSKYELLNVLLHLDRRKPDESLIKKEISFEIFTKRIKNVLKGRITKQRILMVDEGHDCHAYEREIFYELFSPENVVVSFGGKEQLIRFANTCNWEVFRNKEIGIKKIGSGNKSYRIKQYILDFCNFIAESHDIDLRLQSYSNEDLGQLLFDFRPLKEQTWSLTFSNLLERGSVNGCAQSESLLILDVNIPNYGGNEVRRNQIESAVNEYNVMEESIVTEYKVFNYLQELGRYSEYWVGAVADKKSIGFPSPNEVRVINYESCRGLEAWCVMCLNFDRFFISQYLSDNAEKYLLHEGIYLSKEQRAAKYAITWILMAASRAIDTLFMQMADRNNEFVKLCIQYAKTYPNKCTALGL